MLACFGRYRRWPLFFFFLPPPSSYSSLKEETAKVYSPQRRNCRHFERNIKPKEGEKGLECIDLSFRLPLCTCTHTISVLFMIKCIRLSAQEITRCSDCIFLVFFLNPKPFPDYFIFIFCLCSASFLLLPALSPFLSPKLPYKATFLFLILCFVSRDDFFFRLRCRFLTTQQQDQHLCVGPQS